MTEQQQQVLGLLHQMFLSPQEFCYRHSIGYEQLAEICCLSKSTTYHWLGGQASRRIASRPSQRILAMTDILLSNTEQAYPLVNEWRTRHSLN